MTWKNKIIPRFSSNKVIPFIGMRVMALDDYCYNPAILKAKGRIIIVEGTYHVSVEFDKNIDGHTCDGNGRNGHCWGFSREYWEKEGFKLL